MCLNWQNWFREIRRKSSSKMPSPSPYALSRLPSVVVKEATPNPDDQDQVPPMPKRKPSMVRQISLSSKEKLQVIQDHVRSRYLEQSDTTTKIPDMDMEQPFNSNPWFGSVTSRDKSTHTCFVTNSLYLCCSLKTRQKLS